MVIRIKRRTQDGVLCFPEGLEPQYVVDVARFSCNTSRADLGGYTLRILRGHTVLLYAAIRHKPIYRFLYTGRYLRLPVHHFIVIQQIGICKCFQTLACALIEWMVYNSVHTLPFPKVHHIKIDNHVFTHLHFFPSVGPLHTA